jgi:uncharacterized protein (DUF1800 family)
MLNARQAIAANRFGLGARPGDESRIGSEPEAWLLEQISMPATDRPRPAGGARPVRPESARVLAQVGELRLARQAAQSIIANQAIEVDEDAIRQYARFVGSSYQTQAAAIGTALIGSEAPFRERLVEFWANHFAVSADKQPVGTIAAHYRDEAIRPHVSGNFRAMLRAAEQHPAMLLYLDNQTSIGPNSLIGSRANRSRNAGLNENLAREILELHTLGVDGGYTQNDVIEIAKALTGWSIGNEGRGGAARMGNIARRLRGERDAGEPGEFVFRAAVHEPGAKTLLGKRFREDGVEEAEAVLDHLARQPQTARHLATKLARHFVADDPPGALVDRLAASYLEHDGELAPVYRELVTAADAWREPLAKTKTPQEFLVSVYRALGTTPAGRTLVALATELGQRPLTPGSPAGWPDVAAHWNGGDALLKRIEWVTTLGASIGDRIDAVARLDAVLGELASEATRNAVRGAESGAQAIALMFSAPEFQRR